MGNKLNHHTTRGYSQPPLTWPHWLNIIYVFVSLLQCSHLHLSQMPASLSEGHPSRLPEYWLTVARRLFEILRSFLLFLEQRWGGERKSIKRMKSVPAQCLPSASQQSSARQGETTLRYWRVGQGRVRGTGRPEDCLLLSCSSMWVNWPVWFSAGAAVTGFTYPEKRGESLAMVAHSKVVRLWSDHLDYVLVELSLLALRRRKKKHASIMEVSVWWSHPRFGMPCYVGVQT